MIINLNDGIIKVESEEEREALLDVLRHKGEWIMNKTSVRGRNYTCTNCEKISRNKFDYCPNCGADMKGVNNES